MTTHEMKDKKTDDQRTKRGSGDDEHHGTGEPSTTEHHGTSQPGTEEHHGTIAPKK